MSYVDLSNDRINQEDNPLAIQSRGFSFAYGNKLTIDNISINIYQNQVTAIIGPSGCGKSTFLKSLNRIAELEGKVKIKGRIDFFGQDIYSKSVNVNRLRREIGMVFQRPNPFHQSIYENIAYGVKLIGGYSKGEINDTVEIALTDAALWDEVKDSLKKSALGLSGGQQQRLCIARALAVQPQVLLMDEPCSALDPISTRKIEDLIHTLKEQLTIVMVTHNMQQAARVADYTAFFNTDDTRIGQLVEFGTTQQIFNGAIDRSTQDYVSGRFG